MIDSAVCGERIIAKIMKRGWNQKQFQIFLIVKYFSIYWNSILIKLGWCMATKTTLTWWQRVSWWSGVISHSPCLSALCLFNEARHITCIMVVGQEVGNYIQALGVSFILSTNSKYVKAHVKACICLST